MSEEKKYEEDWQVINVAGLATSLAEDVWEQEVKAKGLTDSDLYETIIEKRPDSVTPSELKKQVKPYWASTFFLLRDRFLELIHCYSKNSQDETRKERGFTGPEETNRQ